ncbi:hypothetical protein KIS4809_2520 [Bacillus sp. ZZV12-4809]|nr:hypothetical protein KIS4809_2520 [Bacillus sp. ZZV12-4809]
MSKKPRIIRGFFFWHFKQKIDPISGILFCSREEVSVLPE